MDNLPPPSAGTPQPNGANGGPGASATGGSLNAQPTGLPPSFSLNGSNFGAGGSLSPSGPGVGLRPQQTGGAPNPFRASMMMTGNNTGMPPFGGAGGGMNGNSQLGGLGSPTGSFGQNLFSTAGSGTPGGAGGLMFKPTLTSIPSFGGPGMGNGNANGQHNSQQQTGSLI